MKIHYIIIAAALLTIASGCKNSNNENADTDAQPQQEVTEQGITDNADPEIAHEDEATQTSYFEQKAKTAAKPATKPVTTAKKDKAAPETIYVETEGAQGRVWGHVTMKGDKGTGTIHDWDENTLAVSVTRHGNEFFAVDQNSRQYVFKLKQNKTQE